MRVDSTIPPSLPFHVARAYGANGGGAGGSAGGVGAVQPVSNRIVTTPVQPVARVGSGQESTSNAKDSTRRLVAGVVPGKVDFSADTPRPSDSSALAFYRHPADKNSAATSVQLGRSLDVSG